MIDKILEKRKNIDKKIIQKRRTVKYFINAVKKIQESEGLDAVSIKKVADIASYNSATIYNYFENLEHLLFFASMEYFKEYIEELPLQLKGKTDSLEIYITIWQCFLEHSFRHPENYYSIFFAKNAAKARAYIDDYYMLYPLDTSSMTEDVKDMMQEKDLFTRGNIAIRECIKEGYFEEKEGYELNSIITYIYESFLFRVIHHQLDAHEADKNVNNYLINLIKKYKLKC